MPLHGVSRDVPCARCGQRNPANKWGEACVRCRREAEERARRLARLVAPVVALLVALYVFVTVPADPMPRFYGGLGVLLTYLLARRIVVRVGTHWFARPIPGQEPAE